MPTPFENLDVEAVAEMIPDADAGWLQSNFKFYDGDHWQDAAGWSGPRLPADHAMAETTLNAIKLGFVSKNVIKEAVNRHVGGLLGRTPHWQVSLDRPEENGNVQDTELTPEEEALVEEAETILRSWWHSQQGIAPLGRDNTAIKLCSPHEVAHAAMTSTLLATRGSLHLLIPAIQAPDGETEGDGSRTAFAGQLERMDLEQAVNRIFVQHIRPTQSTVHIDPASMARLGIYLYEHDDDLYCELSHVVPDQENATIVRVLGPDGEVATSEPLKLGGRILLYEMERDLFVNDSVQQMQKALNKAETMGSRNLDWGGFLERIILNAQPPGEWVDDPANPGAKKFVPSPIETGAGVTTWLAGLEVEDDDGKRKLATPKVSYREPVPSDTFIESSRAQYRNMLETLGQLHILLAGQGQVSGESRKRAQADFEKSLRESKTPLDDGLSWMLETVLHLVSTLTGQPERYAQVRVNVETMLDFGIIGSAEKKETGALYKDGLLSRRSAMKQVGIEDPEGEEQRILSETDEYRSLDMLDQQSRIYGQLIAAGLDRPIAAFMAQMSDDAIMLLAGVKDLFELMKEKNPDLVLPNRAPSQPTEDTQNGSQPPDNASPDGNTITDANDNQEEVDEQAAK